MGLTRRLLGALTWLGWLCAPSPARAQTSPSVELHSEGVTHSTVHGNQRASTVINLADCKNGDVITFPLTLSGSRSYSLQAWAGVQCEDKVQRAAVNQDLCWHLGTLAAIDGSLQVPLPVRDILSGRTVASDPCAVGDPIYLPQALKVYFLLVDAATLEAVSSDSWSATFKLTRPTPPDQVSVGIGQEELLLHFAYSELSADTTLNGFEAYCDPAPGSSHEGAPGAADPGTCQPSAVLAAGTEVEDLAAHRCGAAARTASTATIGSLTAGVSYNVGLAAWDSYGNESLLSPVVCQVPSEKLEQNMTSSACAFSRRGSTLPLLVVSSLAGLLAARRRRCPTTATVATS